MISAKIIAHSIANNIPLITAEWCYPRFIHSEVMTHRMFSRNASSSRAIPIEKMMLQVLDTPATPISWGKNKPGMQADITLDEWGKSTCKNIWLNASRDAIKSAKYLAEQGLHKQVANRLLEPFQWIKVIVTATEWDNFFKLRLHPDAQPEIQELAKCMKQAIDESTPVELKPGEWHTPYGMGETVEERRFTSVAGCARVSYDNHDGSNRTVIKDIKLHNDLFLAGHMSPFEHQATPMSLHQEYWGADLGFDHGTTHKDINGFLWSGNFRGWIQYRQLIS